MRLPSLKWTGRSMTSGLARVVSRGHKARRSEAFCEESGSTGWVIGGAAWIRHMWLCSGAPPHDALPAIPLGRLSCASGSTCNGVNSEDHRSHYPCIYRIHSYTDDTACTIRYTSTTSANMASTALIDADMAPTLQSILDQKTLRWIFVGGKGGVGKTTTSCSLAIQLAKHRKSVLLISTDPAHNLSDAFNQKFGKDARLVNGFDNLSAMEIDPNGSIQDLLASGAEEGQDPMAGLGGMGSMMQDLAFSIPGVDEAMSFAEVLKQVKSMSYEVIIFDTAPTGHTLRFLQFPTVMEKALSKVSQLSRQFGPMLNSFLGGSGRLPNGQNMDELVEKMENLRETIGEVNGQFKDADLTTFVCVCIPEFLSLYETERMIQELNSYEIDTHSIVVNQLLFPKQDNPCEQCNARRKMQKKYLDQIEELYDEFNVVKMPLLVEEVRGKEKLEKFSEMLVKPFVPPQ